MAKAKKAAKANGKKAAPAKKATKKATPKLDAATQAEVAKVSGEQKKKADKPLHPVTQGLKDLVEPKVPTTKPTEGRTLTPGQKLTKTFRSGGTHTATVQPDGKTIRYEGTDFTSLSSVATAMIEKETGKPGSANGWAFFGLIERTEADPVGTFTRSAEAIYVKAQRLMDSREDGAINAVADLARKLDKLLA